MKSDFRFVRYLWDEAYAARLSAVERLVYRSNLLGADQRITNTGGGNTSSKVEEKDPLTGEPVEVLWVKGSGGDLRTAKTENFASLTMPCLQRLRTIYERSDKKGPKTDVEDRMVSNYPHCTYNLNPRASSIDTPLHAFVPFKNVDHTHPNAVIAVAASRNGEAIAKKIYGDEIVWLPWQRPGFDLGLMLAEACARNPKAKGAILGQHGLINWANDDRAVYDLSLELIEKTAAHIEHEATASPFGGQKYSRLSPDERDDLLVGILPWLRGQISQGRRLIGTVQTDDAILQFVNSHDAPRLAELGTSCPDHFLRTKIRPLFVDWDPVAKDLVLLKRMLAEGLEKYRADYAAYYNRCRHPDSPAMRDPNPTVILIPGLGMAAWGKDKSESRVTAEFYNCAVEVMLGAETLDEYIALPQQEAFDIEYWRLEEAKLRRMPPEKELARKVIVVFGAGSGIGREVGRRVVRDGAHLVSVDLNQDAANDTADEIIQTYGQGIGVAGSGVSQAGPAVGLAADITDRPSVRSVFRNAVLAYGGFDGIAITAAVFFPPDPTGKLSDSKWAATLNVNITGSYIAADEGRTILVEQGLPASIVLTSSANAIVAKKGSIAYDISKAATNHLVRELAIEYAPLIRVNAVAPATVVQGSGMFPRERVRGSLQKYQITFLETESTEELTAKLAQFYADRTLTHVPITPADQAEAYFALLSDRFRQTAGQIFAVDGGLSEAFLR